MSTTDSASTPRRSRRGDQNAATAGIRDTGTATRRDTQQQAAAVNGPSVRSSGRPQQPGTSAARTAAAKQRARKAARQQRIAAREAKAAVPRKPYPVWLVTAVAFVLPGGGQVLNADPIRGIIMQFFMMLLAFITYMLTSPDISYFGRFAGGFLIYIVSVLDAYSIAKKRSRAWERITGQSRSRTASG